MARILLVEDDADIQQLVRWNLDRDGHAVSVASRGDDALHELRRQAFDLILLDLMLPDRDGLELCRMIRADARHRSAPIIILSAKSEESDVVLGLGLGADDYVPKPFRIKELLARIKVRLASARGAAPAGELSGPRIEVGPLVIEPAQVLASVDGRALPLTLTEFKLLRILAASPGVVFGRYELIDKVSDGSNVITDRTVDTHIRNLRRKLGDHEWLVETVRGVGYRLCPDPEAAGD